MNQPLYKIFFLAIALWALCLAMLGEGHAYPLPPVRPAILPVEGLSQNSVYSIYRDSRGYYWFGTADGLNRYDGYRIKVYRNHASDTTSLTNSTIRALGEDHFGNIWVGCDIGVNKFNRKTGSFSRYLDGVHDSLGICSVSVGEDDSGTLWVVSTLGIFRYDPDHESMNRLSGLVLPAGVVIHDAQFGKEGRVWLGTNLGLLMLDTRRATHPIKFLEQTKGSLVATLLLLADGSIVASVENDGVYRINEQKREYFKLSGIAQVSCIRQDSLERLWIGTRKEGIVVIDLNGHVLERYPARSADQPGLPSPITRAIEFDPIGLIFVGMDGGGVVKIDPHANRFPILAHDPKKPNSIGGNFIKALFEDRQENFWVGTANDGISRFDNATGKWSTFRHDGARSTSLSSNSIKAISQDASGAIWVITDVRLEIFDPVRNVATPVHHPLMDKYSRGSVLAYSLFPDSAGTMWLGTNAGLEEYSPATHAFTIHNLRDLGWPSIYAITGIYVSGKNFRLALGTQYDGVLIVDPRTNEFTQFTNRIGTHNTLSNNLVKTVCWSSGQRLWAGTEDGLNLIDPDHGFLRAFGEQDGLANSYIYGVLEDPQGSIWASTNNGLIQYNPSTGRIRNFDTDDGLQGTEFNTGAYCRDRDGNLSFGGINGVNIFDPRHLSDNPFPPLVRILGVKTDQRILADEEDILASPVVRIAYADRTFEVEYIGIEYSDPLKVRYQYRMDGVESDWVQAGSARFARYTTLTPGEYTLHVIATNADGIASPVSASIRIIIVPPFWRTLWFMAIVSIVFLVLVTVVVRLITLRTVRRRLEEAERRNALERERTRIAKDMHDEVGASLTRIALLSDSVHRQSGVPEGASKQMEKISAAAREVIENMSEIIWAMNPGNDTLDNLAAYMRQHIAESCEIAGLNYEMSIDDSMPGLKVSSEFRRNVFLSVKEALHNSMKHAGARGIHFTMRIEGQKELVIKLTDDGAGFALETARQFGNGLKNMPKRIEEIHGSFEITSSPGLGTTVSMRIPITTFM